MQQRGIAEGLRPEHAYCTSATSPPRVAASAAMQRWRAAIGHCLHGLPLDDGGYVSQ
jgi:hypothetical protein